MDVVDDRDEVEAVEEILINASKNNMMN